MFKITINAAANGILSILYMEATCFVCLKYVVQYDIIQHPWTPQSRMRNIWDVECRIIRRQKVLWKTD